MDAKDLLRLYRGGCTSFVGENLAALDLSRADLIGIDLSQANLQRASFIFAFLGRA